MSKVQSTYDGFVGLGGVPILLATGDEYDTEHPLVEARPELFTEPPARRQAKPQPTQTTKKATDG